MFDLLASSDTDGIGAIIAAVLAVVTTIGGGARWLIHAVMKSQSDMHKSYADQLETKDKLIEETRKRLESLASEHAQTVERLQGETIKRVEMYSENVAELTERFVEQQSEIASILRSIEVSMAEGTGK